MRDWNLLLDEIAKRDNLIEELEAQLIKAVNETLDTANTYLDKQYGIAALSHPADRQRIISKLRIGKNSQGDRE